MFTKSEPFLTHVLPKAGIVASLKEPLNQHSLLPEKVHFAIELAVPGEAPLGEVAVALAALHALGVPGSVQHVE